MSNNALDVIKDNSSKHELIQLVSFTLEKEEYGVEVLKVREIIRMPAITHMPNTPHYAEGIINLRGKVIPIISLRKRFGMMEAEYSNQTRIIVMDVDGELMGFIVDSVSEVIRVSGSEVQPPPTAISGGVDQECISGVINRAESLLVLLDLNTMFTHEEKKMFGEL